MKKLERKFCYVLIICLLPVFSLSAQPDDSVQTKGTLEFEAARQTERMKEDFDLAPTQEKLVYHINLKYERERRQQNSRTQALQRIKNKNNEMKKVLTEKQYKLYQKKYLNKEKTHEE